ncbi:MAG TPA: hypothetical protein V6C97_19140 [Oculatellaceae cyanobacterium]
MSEQQKIIVLNREVRIFDGHTPFQLCCLFATVLLACYLSSFMGASIKVIGLPLKFLVFLATVCIGIVIVKMPDVAPLTWWWRRLQFLGRKMPVYLPDVRLLEFDIPMLSSEGGYSSCFKLNGTAFAALGLAERRQTLDLLFDYVLTEPQGLQMFVTSLYPQNLDSEPEVYVLTSDQTGDKHSLPARLKTTGLNIESVDENELRTILFAHLSPTHFASKAPVPPKRLGTNDLLSVCIAGFEQHLNYVSIDGQYVRSLYLKDVPASSYFGIMNRLSKAGCNLSYSLHLRGCDQNAVRAKAKTVYHLGLMSAGIPDPAAVSEYRRLLNGESSAFDMSLYITLYSDSLERLNIDVRKIEQILINMGAQGRTAQTQELDALLSTLPILENKLQVTHRINSNAAATFFPFT